MESDLDETGFARKMVAMRIKSAIYFYYQIRALTCERVCFGRKKSGFIWRKPRFFRHFLERHD